MKLQEYIQLSLRDRVNKKRKYTNEIDELQDQIDELEAELSDIEKTIKKIEELKDSVLTGNPECEYIYICVRGKKNEKFRRKVKAWQIYNNGGLELYLVEDIDRYLDEHTYLTELRTGTAAIHINELHDEAKIDKVRKAVSECDVVAVELPDED